MKWKTEFIGLQNLFKTKNFNRYLNQIWGHVFHYWETYQSWRILFLRLASLRVVGAFDLFGLSAVLNESWRQIFLGWRGVSLGSSDSKETFFFDLVLPVFFGETFGTSLKLPVSSHILADKSETPDELMRTCKLANFWIGIWKRYWGKFKLRKFGIKLEIKDWTYSTIIKFHWFLPFAIWCWCFRCKSWSIFCRWSLHHRFSRNSRPQFTHRRKCWWGKLQCFLKFWKWMRRGKKLVNLWVRK